MKILIIDLYNMIHRARHSFIKGEHACIFNFFRSLKSEITRHKPDLVYLVSEGIPVNRLNINPQYKGTRDRTPDEDFNKQKQIILELSQKLPVIFARHATTECDDVISFLASDMYKKAEVVICSTDTDFIKLLEKNNVKLWNPIKKKFIEKWPVDYLVYKSLKGDKSDNVSGVRGIGEKKAMKLASDPEGLREFLESSDEIRSQYESSYEQIKFVKINPDDYDFQTKICDYDIEHLYDCFVKFNFKSIVGKSWHQWVHVMEELNESRNKAVTNDRAI